MQTQILVFTQSLMHKSVLHQHQMGHLQSFFITKCCSILILILFLNLANSYATTNTTTISSLCTQTPYPTQCQHYLNHYNVETIQAGSGFFNLVLESALQASLDAHVSASSLGSSVIHDNKQKAAWEDCLELYESATQTLNQITSDPDRGHDDTQTWLSSTLTYFETCKLGFEDLGVKGDNLFPLIGYPNTSYLISNALAINNKQSARTRSTRTRSKNLAPKGLSSVFPRWVKGGDGPKNEQTETQSTQTRPKNRATKGLSGSPRQVKGGDRRLLQTETQTRHENRVLKGLDSNFPRRVKGDDRRLIQTETRSTQTKPENRDPKELDSGFPAWVKGGDRRLLKEEAVVPDIVVAQDGSGDYETVVEGVNAAKEAAKNGGGRKVIYVKAGVYKEYLSISTKNVMLSGDGIGKTVITGSRSVRGGYTTFSSATVAVTGSNFIAKGITFQNTAGAGNHQAVALRSSSDLSVFYQCSFEGYQDTLYVFSNRQFYRDCDVYGTVDFIFGNAAVVFQSCNIHPRRSPTFTNTITAQARSDPNQNTGISIISSIVKPAAGESLAGVRTYLGRPWRMYSRAVFMDTFLDGIVDPAGWLEWAGGFALDTLYYGEYSNTGPGSGTSDRVKWNGFHVITSADEAEKFSVGSFIDGDRWLPETGVPFASRLAN